MASGYILVIALVAISIWVSYEINKGPLEEEEDDDPTTTCWHQEENNGKHGKI